MTRTPLWTTSTHARHIHRACFILTLCTPAFWGCGAAPAVDDTADATETAATGGAAPETPGAARDAFITVDGRRVHYLDWGGAGNQPFIMLHGIARTAHSFDHIAPHFAADYRVLAVDLRGHGDSDWHPDGAYLVEDYVTDIEALVDQLQLRDIVILGNSTGGRVAQVFAGLHSELVSRLIVEDVGPERPNNISDNFARRVEAEADGWASEDELFAQLRADGGGGVSDALLRTRADHGTREREDGRVVWKRDPNLVMGFVPTELWRFIEEIADPTIYILGGDSNIVPPETQERLRQTIPDVEIVVFPGVGHYPSLEAPLEYLAELDRFLARSPDGTPTVFLETPMRAPAWAFAQRALLEANAAGAAAFSATHLDEAGHLRTEERWGVADGPDDTMETIRLWPLAYALGGPDSLLANWERAWEGHLDQYSSAKIPSLELARDGIYHKEFITSFDWEHTGEALGGFYFYGLARPDGPRYAERMRRFAGFYMNEDPEAPNYDPEHRLIRSLFNGSRGPKLTPATPDDWDGEEVPGANPARRTRFLTASNIAGDHPLNLGSTLLAMHAYMLTHEAKYREWILEYVGAWRERTLANGGNIPSNIGLDGTIGGEWGGRWYGGVFGWDTPDEGRRNYVLRGPPEAFGAALLLTGDQRFVDVLRGQIDNLYRAQRVENGRVLLPHYHGDEGWYGYGAEEYHRTGALGNLPIVEVDVYMYSMRPADLARARDTAWMQFLEGRNPDYPLKSLQEALEQVRSAGQRLAAQADDEAGGASGTTRGFNASPVSTTALVNLTMGANDPGGSSHGPNLVHAQVRHFDPERRRTGLPEDVAALVERIASDAVTVTLVNTNPLQPRTVVMQTGAYAEHELVSVEVEGRTMDVGARQVAVRLAPGAGSALTIRLQRYAHAPTLAFPWNRN